MTVRAVNIAISAFCSAELIVILLNFPHFKTKIPAYNLVFKKLLVSVFMTASYAFSLVPGLHSRKTFAMVLDIISILCLYAVIILYMMYIREYINSRSCKCLVPAGVIYISVTAAFLGAAFKIGALFANHTEIIDRWGAGDPIDMTADMVSLIILSIIAAAVIIRGRDAISNREKTVLFSMPILITIAVLAEPFSYELELKYPAVVLQLLIVFTYHMMEIESKMEADETRGVRKRVNLAVGRIQPHYLYNVLTTIYYLCDTDPAEAQHAVGAFSEYLRSSLESMERKEHVPFSWEMDVIRNYMELEKIRFGDKLNVKYDIQYDDFTLLPLCVQPLVENAVKYGIGAKEEGGTIEISARKMTEGDIEIIVKDDGAGFDVEKAFADDKDKEGIAGLRERIMRECCGELKIISSADKGTEAVITLRNK